MNWEKFVSLKNIGFLITAQFILIFIYAFITSTLTYTINEEIPQWITYTIIYSLILLADSIVFKYARVNDPRYQEKATKILMIYFLPIGLLLANSYVLYSVTIVYRYYLYPKIFGLSILMGLLIAYASFLKEKIKISNTLQEISTKIAIATLIAILINGILINSQLLDKIISTVIIILAIINIIVVSSNYKQRTPLYTATVITLNLLLMSIKLTEFGYQIALYLWSKE